MSIVRPVLGASPIRRRHTSPSPRLSQQRRGLHTRQRRHPRMSSRRGRSSPTTAPIPIHSLILTLGTSTRRGRRKRQDRRRAPRTSERRAHIHLPNLPHLLRVVRILHYRPGPILQQRNQVLRRRRQAQITLRSRHPAHTNSIPVSNVVSTSSVEVTRRRETWGEPRVQL